jgi:glutamate racemase
MKKLAFFDSGLGGLTVLYESLKQMPYEQYIYFADSDNAPYGTQSTAAIKALVFDALDFLIQQDIKALVVACNTATSVVIKDLRQQYSIPIIGMEPAIKPAIALPTNKKTLVCATNKTLAENKLQLLIENLNATDKVERLSLQGLVSFAENFEFEGLQVRNYLNHSFLKVNWSEFDSIVLGCTHFIYFKNIIKELIPPHIHILDGNKGTIKHLQSTISLNTNSHTFPIDFFSSKKPMPAAHFAPCFALLDQQNL